MAHEDVVWRADTGQYHARATGQPILYPPMLGAPAPVGASTATPAPASCAGVWLGSPELTNLLLFLIFLALILRES